MNKSSRIMLLTLLAATTPWVVAPVIAAPVTSPLMLRSAAVPSVETARYRRGYGYGGAAVGLGIAGALIGGAIIGATQPYGYYGYPPGYYGPAYVAPAPYIGGDAAAYCVQRFRSYDPYSGTYVGYDACGTHARDDGSLSFGSSDVADSAAIFLSHENCTN